ncbi:pyridoxamine 5'-phosphate oxidase family protein [Geosporobacter ferrireducens]|uniref:General stress protein 26 n=1 Tax=Geosporobacter ferrireducens TaxID=1424294 RepID=A0A1D8GNP0_9FIRM|nr:pyridoxamine 5'-phosphate oxidase family protein [Geosporobacter ferrireducens]AOT72477.1 general stress protein 26 [Geosporobacter ferrireducens]MTI58227.1 general stress protein 26 [Geosporobacter ferrireducens]
MGVERAYLSGLELVENSKIVMLSNNGEDGYPYTKAMMRLKHDGLSKFWLSTNTSTKRVELLKNNNKANLYFVDENNFKGLMLVGTIEILQDRESKEMLWNDGCEIYYPLGVDDPDYTVLCFTAVRGNFYHGLRNTGFRIGER